MACSEKLGWLRYRDNQEEVFLGHSVARSQSVSEETARLIDSEVRRLIEEAEAAARKVLTENLDELHRLAGALLEYETLNGEEAKKAIKGEDIGREDPNNRRPVLPASGTSIPSTRRPARRRYRRPRRPGGLASARAFNRRSGGGRSSAALRGKEINVKSKLLAALLLAAAPLGAVQAMDVSTFLAKADASQEEGHDGPDGERL